MGADGQEGEQVDLTSLSFPLRAIQGGKEQPESNYKGKSEKGTDSCSRYRETIPGDGV